VKSVARAVLLAERGFLSGFQVARMVAEWVEVMVVREYV